MTETNKWTTCKTVCLGLVKWKESHLQSSKQNNKRGTGGRDVRVYGGIKEWTEGRLVRAWGREWVINC